MNGLIKKAFICAFCFCVFMAPQMAGAAQSVQSTATPISPQVSAQDTAYLAAVDQIIAHKNQPADWTALRKMFVHTSFYDPKNGGESIWAQLQAAGQKTLIDGTPETLAAYQLLLRQYFAHYRAHLQVLWMMKHVGFTHADKDLHLAALRGILSSILASGDGKTAQTAFHVLDTTEENLVLKLYYHYQPKGQKYEHHDNHSWDVVDYVNPANDTASKMYFNVDNMLLGR